MGEGLKRVAKACGGSTAITKEVTVTHDAHGCPVVTYRCIFCGIDSGTADQNKFADWYRAHRALTCRRRMDKKGGS